MNYYRDLNDYIQALEGHGKLFRYTGTINKDTELMALVRWQFRGLPESQRRAFLFDNIVSAAGKKYSIPVLVGAHAASTEIYALGMQCPVKEITAKWTAALRNPIPPQLVEAAPAQEEVHTGDGLLDHGGLAEFPVPISVPGFDNAPYLTAANWTSKDPESCARNMGNYRAMLKSPTRLGICCLGTQHLRTHWEKCRAKGIPLPAAIAMGSAPNVGYVATAKIPYGTDELAVAGGIAGEPVRLVKCKTVDLEVPADAEIIIEGVIPTDSMELEGPFGEYTGYMGMEQIGPYFNVTCITHRKNPILNTFIAQFPPSESSKLNQVASEGIYYKFLKYDCNIPGILDVALYESSGSFEYMVIQMQKGYPAEAWQALNCAAGLAPTIGKFIIAVDEDVDPRDHDSVIWALSFCVQPHRDTRITQGKAGALDPSSAPMTAAEKRYPPPSGCSAILIDATRKWPYPPVSLPGKSYMEQAKKLWQQAGLPELQPKLPWCGYNLGYWGKENELEAQLALEGRHWETGEKLKEKRVKL